MVFKFFCKLFSMYILPIMDNFKHINFDINRRKLNNWKRRINSNSLNMGIIKKTKPIEEPVDSIIPSEISSLCSDDNIFKLTSSKPALKVKTNPMLHIRKKTLQKPKPQRPPSPLVFLDLNEFKNNNIIEKPVKKPIKYEKAQHKTAKQTKIGTPKSQQKPKSKIIHKAKPFIKQSIKKDNKPLLKITDEVTKKYRKEEVYKINTKITTKIKHKHKNNKKYLEEANHFSLKEIKQNLNKKNIQITDKAPENLVRNLYILCNINV